VTIAEGGHYSRLLLFDDFEDDPAVGARGHDVENRADRADGAPLLADQNFVSYYFSTFSPERLWPALKYRLMCKQN
jgi:hypothetical protein